MNFDETEQNAVTIELDKHSSDAVRTGFSMQQPNTTHHLSCPGGLLRQVEPQVME